MISLWARRLWRAWRRGLMACCAIGLASSALAEPLTLGAAVRRALDGNPEFAVVALEARAQQGVQEQAAARPPLQLGLNVENVLGSGSVSGADAAETTLSLGFLLDGRAREQRVAVAAAGAERLVTETRLKQLDVAAETARRFVTVLAHQLQLTEAREATKLVEQSLQAVRTRVSAARAPRAEEARADANLARSRLALEHAEHALAAARLRLAAMWGATDPDFDAVQGDLSALPDPPPFEQFQARLDRHPDVERLLSEQRVREAELRLAQVRVRPPWELSAGVRRLEQTGDHALVLGVSRPIAAGGAVRGAITEARARMEIVAAQSIALRAQLHADVFALYQELQHSSLEVKALRDDVLPKISGALEQSRYAYERGRYGYLEWAAAQRELLDARMDLIDAMSRLHQYRIELERLTGTALGVADKP